MPLVPTRIKKVTTPYVITMFAIIFSAASILGFPEGKIAATEEEFIEEESEECIVQPSKTPTEPFGKKSEVCMYASKDEYRTTLSTNVFQSGVPFFEKAKYTYEYKVRERLNWREMFIKIREELREEPSEDEPERLKQLAENHTEEN